jgi:hypothetical protein
MRYRRSIVPSFHRSAIPLFRYSVVTLAVARRPSSSKSNRKEPTMNDDEITSTKTNEMRGAGGTPGGLGEFLFGLAMAAGGGYLLMNQVTVSSGAWQLWGYNAFGLSLIPLLIGIGLLFFDGRSKAGWILTVFGALVIFLGILTNLTIFFRPTSLFGTMIILVLLVGGLGLVARSLRSKA